MTTPCSDAFVFFGATGDLAYKKIFPAPQALIQRGRLDVPVVGVARSRWTLDQFNARAGNSLEKAQSPGSGGVYEALRLVALCSRRVWVLRLGRQRPFHGGSPPPGVDLSP